MRALAFLPTLVALSAATVTFGWASRSNAHDAIPVEPMHERKLRIDGTLGEWPAGFAKLDSKVSGRKLNAEAMLGYDDRNVYVALRASDKTIARTTRGGDREDHLRVELWVPRVGGGAKTVVLAIYPGDPGKLPGLVVVDGRPVGSAKAVEAVDKDGLELEAQLPWSVLEDLKTTRVGLRGRFVYTDANAPGSVEGVVASTAKTGEAMPPFPLENETGLFQFLLDRNGLPTRPAKEAFGNVFGGPETERVALYGHFLSIVGSGYKDGREFYFNELDVELPDQIKRLELVDFAGDGKSEIVLVKELGTKASHREVVQVLTIGNDGAPLQVFAHELSIVTPEGSLESELTLTKKGPRPSLSIRRGKAKGFDPESFREPKIGGGITTMLMPWSEVSERTFEWKGEGLALADEKKAKAPSRPGKTSSPSTASSSSTKKPPAPRPPSEDELLEQVLALYKKDRGVKEKKPRFDFVTDVAEDETMERVLVFEKDLVVFGKGYRKGLGYASITLGVKEPADVLSVTTSDLTGDGHAEILVHAILRAKASPELGGDTVDRQALLVYQVQGDEIKRVLGVETGRSLGKKRVLGSVLFVPRGNTVDVVVDRLRAIGYTEKTYPFPEDTTAAGGLEPLLLPWGTVKRRVYEYRGGTFSLAN